jgi:hypothetical protein
MTVTIGTGALTYKSQEGWAKLSGSWEFGDVAAVGVDGWDRVYCFNRGAHPMIVLDRDGNFLKSPGEDIFNRAHGMHMGTDDTIYLTDYGEHTVRHCTLDGKILLEIGIPGKAAPYMSGEPFNRCTDTALSSRGDIYVGEVAQTSWSRSFPNEPNPKYICCPQKLVKVAA